MLPSRAFHLLSIMITLSTCCPRRKSLTPFGTFAIAGSIMPLEVLKLAITVTGLHLLNEENLNEVERLHKDLMLLARCEELTSFVVYALELGHLLENEDLWEILTHTRGWGRVWCYMPTMILLRRKKNMASPPWL